MNKYFLLLIFIFLNLGLFSQETLINCGHPFLKNYSNDYFKNNSLRSASEVDTLELPFFDDFAKSFVYPDSTKWMDKYAFINYDYAIAPISIGVATLDAIDEHGAVYPTLPSVGSKIADYLTSLPINLAYHPSDSIYLSFYYQAGGKGNKPEVQDSLVLQFRTPQLDWESVWHVAGGEAMDTFNLVLIPIVNETYLKKGFQFRFLNYASVSSNYEPSWKSNSDHWHIDYVKLNKQRTYTDTLMNDVSFVYNLKSIIKDFESVPWKHFNNNSANILVDTVSFVYLNTWNETYNINRSLFIFDDYYSSQICTQTNDNENIHSMETIEYSKRFDCDLYSYFSEDSAKFLLLGHIYTDTISARHMYRWNDTIKYYQIFNNYYAYDDGTAESGYGITGAQGSMAYKFTPLVADTLKGVYLYFNQVINEANRKNFYLTVWADNNGSPGQVLQEIEGVVPIYSDEINKYVYYPLASPLYINSTFYIGWRKTTTDVLNCGYDVNRVVKNKLFYNVNGQWQMSQFQGALMVRPVFGIPPTTYVKENIAILDFEIFPNPSSDFIRINSDNEYEYFELYDTNGKLLLSEQQSSESIDISNLQSGIYYITLQSNLKTFKTKKVMVLK